MFNLKLDIDLNQHWSNIGIAHHLSIADSRAKLFANPTRGSKDIRPKKMFVSAYMLKKKDGSIGRDFFFYYFVL